MNDTGPKTLIEAVRHFSDLAVCQQLLVKQKWPDGKITCPACAGDKIGNIASRCMLQCKAKECRKQFSAKVGTIFEDSPLGLDKWFVAVWCIANAKNGISSCELARALGVRQPTAWSLLHRLKVAMETQEFLLAEPHVEYRCVSLRSESASRNVNVAGIVLAAFIGRTFLCANPIYPPHLSRATAMTFDELLRALLAVGKKELDRAEKRYRAKKAKRKKK